MTSNKKEARRIRKLYRKEIRDSVRETLPLVRKIIRPKPWWIPRPIWHAIVRIVIVGIKL